MTKFALLLLLLALAAYGQQEQKRVAILNTEGDGDLIYLSVRLREIAVKMLPKNNYSIMTAESIIDKLGSKENAKKICTEAQCLAEIGRKVSAAYVGQARVGNFGGNFTISMELYNAASGTLVSSFTGNAKDLFGLLAIIDEQAPILFKELPGTSDIASAPSPQQEPLQQPNTNMEQQAKIQQPYDENKMSTLGYFALNFVPGFGLGSYIQGDITSGIKLSIADVVGWPLTILGILAVMKGNDVDLGWALAISGGSIVCVSRVMGLIYTFNYTKKYNKSLEEALNSNSNVSLSIDPLIIPRDGTPAVGLAFNVRY
ncbi:MAG: P13 family porin [Fibromonadaceae bacterium]|jgi:hypothetical protein|nr:P13 family porin [Fibromonadaceae bacterium]